LVADEQLVGCGRDSGGITIAIHVDSAVVTSGSATTNISGNASAATTTTTTAILPIRPIHDPVISVSPRRARRLHAPVLPGQ
jgi:hypothetical protein